MRQTFFMLVVVTMLVTACRDHTATLEGDQGFDLGEQRETPDLAHSLTPSDMAASSEARHGLIYRASSYDEVRASGSAPDADLDALVALQFANSVCALDERALTLPLDSLAPASPDNSRVKASLSFVKNFQETFCQTYAGHETLQYSEYSERLAGSGDEGRLLSNALSFSGSPDSEAAQNVQQDLIKQLSVTTSPYFYLTGHDLLLEDPLVDYSAIQNRPVGMHVESLLMARRYGVMLASCEKYDICANNSLFAISTCMPYECMPSGGVEGYVRARLTDSEYDEARRYARELLSGP